MATYAAYRHIELDNIGYGKKRVLKPPGGGSSDIFGMSSEPAEPQRKTKNQHLTSSIFGGETVTESRNKAGNNSFNNLFGSESQSRSASAIHDKSRSNIVLGDDPSTGFKEVKASINDSEDISVTNLGGHTNGAENGIECVSNSTLGVGSMSMFTDPAIPEHKSKSDETVDSPSIHAVDKPAVVEKAAPAAVNGAPASTVTAAPAASAPAPSAAANAPAAKRVPPGGFSSGLW